MNQVHQQWLENRIQASVDDDFYLDRDEEKRIKEEGTAKGILINDIEMVIRTELDKSGSVCERVLLDELELLLHQFTDNDKELDRNEERNALDKVLNPAPGKKKGLDPRVAEEYVAAFCKVNGVKRTSEGRNLAIPVISVILIILAVAGYFLLLKKSSVDVGAENTIKQKSAKITEETVTPHAENTIKSKEDDKSGTGSQHTGPTVILNDNDKIEIDDLLRRAESFIDKAQYTDPPEKCAKACLDSIRHIDPVGQYRGVEIKAMTKKIVSHYISLADKSFITDDIPGTVKWIERAKLLNADTEIIRDKEREYGLLKTEQ